MKYSTYKFLFPPRPETALPPDQLRRYEGQGWCAQFKKNGTGTTIAISPTKEFFVMTRHGTPHKLWQITDYHKEHLARLFPEPEWFYLIIEVLHSKTKTIKNVIYIHDILVYKSEVLYGSTFESRQKILDEHLKKNALKETPTHYVCDPKNKIWFAKLFFKGFIDLFNAIEDTSVDEGLVLKMLKGELGFCFSEKNDNQRWQIKFRHPCKKYNF
jgi:hypothetical protein